MDHRFVLKPRDSVPLPLPLVNRSRAGAVRRPGWKLLVLIFVVLPLAVWSHVPVPLTTTAVGTQVLGTRWRMADLRAYTLVQRWSTARSWP